MSNYKNVAAKVLKMVRSVGEIPRNGSNQTFNYKFVKETDVADKLREACMAAGLVIIPSAHSVVCMTLEGKDGKKDQYRTSLMLKLTLIDPDSGESIDMDFPGEAIDSQDKATPKAITSAYKYGLIKLAMNGGGDGDDMEHDSHEQGGGNGKETKQTTQQTKPVNTGTTYRKPVDEPSKPAAVASAPVEQPTASAPASSKPIERVAAQPADRPLSTITSPAEPSSSEGGEIPTWEEVGRITTVVPAMKNKPAAISFKQSNGTVVPLTFDPKVVDVPKVLSLMNSKVDVRVICDISTGTPHLMSVEKA